MFWEDGLDVHQWVVVKDEKSYCMAGLQRLSRQTNTDYFYNHETMDWNWYQLLDPSFTYLLNYTAKRIDLLDGNVVPSTENEWEVGSFPIQWRPFWGEYVINWGRHIYDVAHTPVKVEMHPAHTIIRQKTTAAPIGKNGEFVPVNHAVIGMGLSGGFTSHIGSRWKDETGSNRPNGIWGDTEKCWVTNLKKHPLKFKMFPPANRPEPDSQLVYRITLCEFIQVNDWSGVEDFLELCQNDDPADGSEGLAFREWNRERNLPSGYRPEITPTIIQPKFTLKEDRYFEVSIDLSSINKIPVGYYAKIECGWDKRPTNHKIFKFTVMFETLTVHSFVSPTYDYTNTSVFDWLLYYGANGEWNAWYPNVVRQNGIYTLNKKVDVLTNENMPLIICDNGIEWGGYDDGNYYLDSMEIFASGPDHFAEILKMPGVTKIDWTKDNSKETLIFGIQVWNSKEKNGKKEKNGDGAEHEWKISIIRENI